MSYRSSWMTEELDVFRDQFRKYLAKDLAPHAEKWREQKMVDRFAWRGLGEMGALLASVPEEYGGLGGAIAMTEPGTGSELQAVKTTAKKQGNSYVINGQKTFITNGQAADLVIVVARTGEPGAKGISLIVVETAGADGYKRGRNLDKIDLHASDTSELFFDNVTVPPENLLGKDEGQGWARRGRRRPRGRRAL